MTYLVTGANRGLGLEYTTQLLAAQKNVIAWARSVETPELAALQKKYPSTLQLAAVDVTSEASVVAALKKITALDVLINNAGVLLDDKETLETLSAETITATFRVNVLAPIFITQQCLPLLGKSASPLVINMSSLMGSISDNASGGYYAYRMSKTALNMFTKSFSVDYPHIKTLCLHPGWVQTDMGGANAPTSKNKSIEGLLRIILEPQKYASGSFINFSGKELEW